MIEITNLKKQNKRQIDTLKQWENNRIEQCGHDSIIKRKRLWRLD